MKHGRMNSSPWRNKMGGAMPDHYEMKHSIGSGIQATEQYQIAISNHEMKNRRMSSSPIQMCWVSRLGYFRLWPCLATVLLRAWHPDPMLFLKREGFSCWTYYIKQLFCAPYYLAKKVSRNENRRMNSSPIQMCWASRLGYLRFLPCLEAAFELGMQIHCSGFSWNGMESVVEHIVSCNHYEHHIVQQPKGSP